MTVSKGALVAALLVSAATTAACHPRKLSDAVSAGAHISTSDSLSRPVEVVDRLDCPQSEGDLTLDTAAPDGRSCAYRSDKGVVNLSLVDAPGGDDAALASFRAEVDKAMPRQAKGASATVSVSSDKTADGRDVSKVDMPFLHVSDDGRRSHVSILGISIDSESHHGQGHMRAGDRGHNVVWSSDDDDSGASNVTVDGPRGRESVYLLAGDPPTPEGYHAVGFVARGDGKGKLVVALFKSRDGNSDDHSHDLDALLDLNARKVAGASTSAADTSDHDSGD